MNHRLLAGVLLAGFSGLSAAANEVNIGMSSEYVFRGVTQSNGAQVWGSFDYALDNTGLYTGLWLSNAGLAGNEEVDVYAGYAMALSDDLSLDVGGIGYFDPSAPSSSTVNNSSEAYVGINWQALNVMPITILAALRRMTMSLSMVKPTLVCRYWLMRNCKFT